MIILSALNLTVIKVFWVSGWYSAMLMRVFRILDHLTEIWLNLCNSYGKVVSSCPLCSADECLKKVNWYQDLFHLVVNTIDNLLQYPFFSLSLIYLFIWSSASAWQDRMIIFFQYGLGVDLSTAWVGTWHMVTAPQTF